MPLPFEAVQAGLMPDEPEDLQRLVFGLMVPQPGGHMTLLSRPGVVADALVALV